MPLIRPISANSVPTSACSVTCNESDWDLCAASVREPSTASVQDVDAAPMRPREPRGFQRFHRFSPNTNIYNKPGNLLSLTQQPPPLEQMEFGHSFWYSCMG